MAYKNKEDRRAFDRRRYAKNRDKILARKLIAMRAIYHADLDKAHSKVLLKKYGITIEQREDLIIEQGGLCAICRGGFPSPKRTHVDHDHKTKKVRGVLCSACNALLGYAKDDVLVLEAAIGYLVKANSSG